MFAERLVEQAGPDRDLAVRNHDLDALVAQDAEAAAGGVLAWVVRADDQPGDAGIPDCVGARRRPALVAAGLERHVQRGAAQVLVPRGAERLDLGVRRPDRLVKAPPAGLVVAGAERA